MVRLTRDRAGAPRTLLVALAIATVFGGAGVSGQEVAGSLIHADGSCDREGVVLQGVADRTINLYRPESTAPASQDVSWTRVSDLISVQCESGALGVRYAFGDGSGDTVTEVVEAVFTGDYDGDHGPWTVEHGLVSRLIGAFSDIVQFDYGLDAQGSADRLVSLSWASVEVTEFTIVRVADEYRSLFISACSPPSTPGSVRGTDPAKC